MFKVDSKEIGTTSLTLFLCLYCELSIYFTPYSGVYIVDFEIVNVCWKPVFWHSIYTRTKRRYHSAVVIVHFECITPFVLCFYC